jgi:hypothetical protein
MKLTLEQLRSLGYVEVDGEWRKQDGANVGRLPSTQPKQNPLPALDDKPQTRRIRTQRVAVCVTLIRVGKSAMDDDNLASCFKGMRDAVAKSLGVDDRDKRIKWEYGQVQSRGRTGTIVKIERT